MAGSLSTYLKNELLDHVFNGGAYTRPATLYAALYTAAPTDDGGGTECTGGSYARASINVWNAAAGKATANTNDVTFATATAPWGTVVAMGIFDQLAVGGNLLCWCDVTSKAVGTGDTAKIAAGEFDVVYS